MSSANLLAARWNEVPILAAGEGIGQPFRWIRSRHSTSNTTWPSSRSFTVEAPMPTG